MAQAHTIEPNTVGDRVLAAFFAVLTQTEVWVFTADEGWPLRVRIGTSVLTLIAAGALAVRRTRPGLSFFANGLSIYLVIALGYPSDVYQWSNVIVTYSVAAHGTSRQRWTALPFAVAGPLLYFYRFPAEGGPALAAFAASMWAVSWLAGRIYGARLEELQLRDERDLSRRLAEANQARLALEEERNRIARELHDIIGHSVSVMVVHAGAGRRGVGGDPAAVARSFDVIAETGRTALSELDRVLAVLRGDEAVPDTSPTPGIADLEKLTATFGGVGLAVDLQVEGDRDIVPASVGLSIYRIVQESLTNILKHAGASHSRVAVAVGDGRIEVEVDDDGDVDPSDIIAGRGLLGIRERAALHGGAVTLGRGSAGGLELRATLSWESQE